MASRLGVNVTRIVGRPLTMDAAVNREVERRGRVLDRGRRLGAIAPAALPEALDFPVGDRLAVALEEPPGEPRAGVDGA